MGYSSGSEMPMFSQLTWIQYILQKNLQPTKFSSRLPLFYPFYVNEPRCNPQKVRPVGIDPFSKKFPLALALCTVGIRGFSGLEYTWNMI
jgi:hypothetical protein